MGPMPPNGAALTLKTVENVYAGVFDATRTLGLWATGGAGGLGSRMAYGTLPPQEEEGGPAAATENDAPASNLGPYLAQVLLHRSLSRSLRRSSSLGNLGSALLVHNVMNRWGMPTETPPAAPASSSSANRAPTTGHAGGRFKGYGGGGGGMPQWIKEKNMLRAIASWERVRKTYRSASSKKMAGKTSAGKKKC